MSIGFTRSLAGLLLTTVLCCTSISGDHWNYIEEDKWPVKCLHGRHQSPINLRKDTAEIRVFNDFQFQNYDTKYMSSITNNGHSVALKLIDAHPPPSIKGGGLPHEYIVDHLHFHWESEHTIHSNRFPLELHVVHYAAIYNSTGEALGNEQGLGVLGVLFDISEEDNPAFDPMLEKLVEIQKNPDQSAYLDDAITIDQFLPKDTGSFFRYEGSLTTPACDEVVVWTVFYQNIYISKAQMKYFLSIWNNDGILKSNYRSLQQLNNRVITFRAGTSGTSLNAVPNLALFLLCVSAYFLQPL